MMVTTRCGVALAGVLALWGSWLSPAPAAAQARPESGERDKVAEVERLYAEGAALYRAGKYRPAIALFKQAHGLIPVANLLYNIARCYQAVGEIRPAMSYYKRFMEHDDADAATRKKAAQRHRMLARALERSKAVPAPKPEPRRTGPPAPRTGAEPPRRSLALAISKWTLAGVALAAGVAGGVMLGLGQADHAKVQDAIDEANGGIVDMTRARAAELTDAGDTRKLAGHVLLGAGGAALATSVVLFVVDRPGERREAALPLNLALTPGGAGATLSGRF